MVLVGVNEIEGARVSTKEGLRSETRLGTILNGVRLCGNCVEGKNMYTVDGWMQNIDDGCNKKIKWNDDRTSLVTFCISSFSVFP